MKTEKYQPFPKNTIYNIYARCNETEYSELVNKPFLRNIKNATCTITIISPIDRFQSDGSFHVIGFGSRKYKKLSFGMKYNKKFLGRKAIKLRGMPTDASLIREPLTSELFKAVGVPVQEGTYARLFMNGEIFGLYSMIDSLNDRWIGAYIHGNKKAKIGINYKLCSSPPDGPYANLRYVGDDISSYRAYSIDKYEKKEINKDDIKTQMSPLIKFTKLYDEWVKKYGNDQSDKAIEELKKFLNIESLLRFLVIETLIMALDNFWLVTSNTSLYFNPERKNYQFIPYDFYQVLEGTQDTIMIPQEDAMKDCLHWADQKENPADHFFTDNLMSHPQIKKRYDIILAITSRKIFDSKVITPYIQSLANLISEDVEWAFNIAGNLHTSYNGKVHNYTLQDFQENLTYDKTNYDKEKSLKKQSFGLSEFIDLRGDSCRAYTSNVNTSDNINISDDIDISKLIDSKGDISAAFAMKKNSLLFIPIQILIIIFI
ncbi:hypothetical protein PIROE2DRAFT_9679 [Piromyces sp. E2]|nr:hypothetical protein PIROE2DRAFT_9679 [Piromyces sp. E2]|eukprot:OUM63740.1 hypothetical protein PIROE2DRAFT_9679 [Piromyces sp. E2]